MVILQGCVQPALAPNINAAAARVLDRAAASSLVNARGRDLLRRVQSSPGRHRARPRSRRGATSLPGRRCWTSGAEALLMSASGCGVMVKDYGGILRADPDYGRARATRERRDARSVRSALGRRCRRPLPGARSATGHRAQSPGNRPARCSTDRNSPDSGTAPAGRGVYTHAGARSAPVLRFGGHLFDFAARAAVRLRSVKLATLQDAAPQLIATANIGCLQHLAAAAAVPVKHWIELIDEASQRDEQIPTRAPRAGGSSSSRHLPAPARPRS